MCDRLQLKTSLSASPASKVRQLRPRITKMTRLGKTDGPQRRKCVSALSSSSRGRNVPPPAPRLQGSHRRGFTRWDQCEDTPAKRASGRRHPRFNHHLDSPTEALSHVFIDLQGHRRGLQGRSVRAMAAPGSGRRTSRPLPVLRAQHSSVGRLQPVLAARQKHHLICLGNSMGRLQWLWVPIYTV